MSQHKQVMEKLLATFPHVPRVVKSPEERALEDRMQAFTAAKFALQKAKDAEYAAGQSTLAAHASFKTHKMALELAKIEAGYPQCVECARVLDPEDEAIEKFSGKEAYYVCMPCIELGE